MKREGKCEGKGVGRCLKAGTMCEEGPPVANMTVRRAYPCSGGQNSRLCIILHTHLALSAVSALITDIQCWRQQETDVGFGKPR